MTTVSAGRSGRRLSLPGGMSVSATRPSSSVGASTRQEPPGRHAVLGAIRKPREAPTKDRSVSRPWRARIAEIAPRPTTLVADIRHPTLGRPTSPTRERSLTDTRYPYIVVQ